MICEKHKHQYVSKEKGCEFCLDEKAYPIGLVYPLDREPKYSDYWKISYPTLSSTTDNTTTRYITYRL